MTNKGPIDLHVHTTASDGIYSPEEVVLRAKEANLSAISIADHDTVEGVEEALREAKTANIEVIPATEIGAHIPNGTLHLLGYFIDINDAELRQRLKWLRDSRKERNQKLLEKLNSLGLKLTAEDVMPESPGTIATRAHFATAIIKKGYVKSWKEAFDRYLGRGGIAYAEREHLPPKVAIEILHRAGGLVSLAHPKQLNRTIPEVAEFVQELVDAGLDAIEVDCPDHGPKERQAYKEMAERHGLLLTGGSDYHGLPERPLKLGAGTANNPIPYEYLQRMKEYLQDRGR